MRKFLFSFVAVLAFMGLFGLQAALSCDPPGESFNCSGGGPFYGTSEEILCWLSQLDDGIWGICGLSPCGTEWTFVSIDNGSTITFKNCEIQ
jgi:hypothetical protein